MQQPVVPLLYGLKIGAIQVYPSSAAAPDALLIPVATVTNCIRRWLGVSIKAAEDGEKKQGKYGYPS